MNYEFLKQKKRNSKIKSKKSLKVEAKKTAATLLFILWIFTGVLSITFFLLSSQYAQKTNALEQLKQESSALFEENTKLTTKITNASSLKKLREDSTFQNIQENNEKDVLFITREDIEMIGYKANNSDNNSTN